MKYILIFIFFLTSNSLSADCVYGAKDKTSFYCVFKSITNTTPSGYIKRIG